VGPDVRSETYFFSSFFASGEDGLAEGDDGEADEPEAEPEALPDALPEDGGVDGLEDDEEGEDDGELEVASPFFEALSPHAARVNAATAAISRDLVIPEVP
jgi:hypothetical protein